MGYLDGSSITVDAILTKQGRKMLAQGQGLNITKFALGDTGVDYKLYNPDHPKGSSFYGEAITNSPQLEACTADHTNLRYTLMTWDRDKAFIPKIVVDKTSVSITEQGYEGEQVLSIKTKHFGKETYTIRVIRSNGLMIQQAPNVTTLDGNTRDFHHLLGIDKDIALGPVTQLKLQAGPILEKQSTAVQIIGDQSGATTVVSVEMSENVRRLPNT